MKRLLSATPRRTSVAVFFLFVLVTLAFTYPLITRMSTHFAGSNIDVWLNMWANWWSRKALREGLPLYQTGEILYPHGVSLTFHSFSHTNTVPWLLLEPLVGPLAAYNVTVLLGFVLLGFGMYLLVKEMTGHVGAGIVSGLTTTFAPYHVWECVHPNIFSTQYIPLALWALIVTRRHLSDPSPSRAAPWWRGALIGLLLSLIALSGWHQPMYALVILGPYLVMEAAKTVSPWGRSSQRVSRQVWLALLIALLVSAALVGPVLLPLLREQLRAGYAQADIDWIFNTDALAWVTPSLLHPLWGDAVRPVYQRFPAPNRPAFVGYTVLALALPGLRRWWRERQEVGWLIPATLLATVLALGTSLYVNGEVVVADLPWYEPIIGFVRAPVRWNLMLGQCLGILAGFGVAELLPRGTAAIRRQVIGVGLVSALVLFEFVAWPFPSTPAYTPPFYTQLANEEGDFAIVEAPLDRQTDKFYMYWQTIHGKSLVNGHVSRPPESAFAYIEGNAITRAFARRDELRGRPDLATALDSLAAADVRYVVIHKQFLPPDLASDWIAALATRPVYEDDDLTVFTTRPQVGVHFGVAHDFDSPQRLKLSQAWLDAGEPPVLESHWAAEEQAISASPTVTLGLSPYPGASADAAAPAPVVHTQAFSVTPGSFSIARTPLTLPDLAPGLYDLFLIPGDLRGALEGPIPADAYVICRLSVDVDSTLCWRSQPGAAWDETIALRGVDWHKLANTLHITLEWEALQAPQADHKFFVHVLPERSEGDGYITDTAPIAQFDGMPCDWSCPTSQWEESDVIVDRL